MNRLSVVNTGLLVTVLCVLLHALLGWAWTLLAGVVAGLLQPRRGLLLGTSCVAVGWTLVLLYTVTQTPEAFWIIVDILGSLGGNIPDEAVVGATVVLGGLIGGVGGALGRLVASLLRPTDWSLTH